MKCRKCTGELTYDEKRGCHFCPVCNPVATTPVITEEPEPNKRVDEPWTEKRIIALIEKVVPDMVVEELQNWHIKKPSVTVAEIKATVGGGEANVNETMQSGTPGKSILQAVEDGILGPKVVETWRETAKRLEIPVYDKEKKCPRKKIDVLKDIEVKQKVPA